MRFTRFVTALFLLLALPGVATATVLSIMAEDSDIIPTGAVSVSTSAGNFRAGWARESIFSVNTGSTVYPGTPRFSTQVFSNQTTLWIHLENFTLSAIIGTPDGEAIGAYGSDGVLRIMLKAHSTSTGRTDIATRNGAGTITTLTACDVGSWPLAGQLNKLDWVINYAVAGSSFLYINGILHCSFTGNTTTDGVSSLNQVEFSNPFGSAAQYSEMIVANSDTRGSGVFTCAPTSNGTNQTWNGGFANVAPTTINDASAITTPSSGQVAEFGCTSPPAGAFTVPAVGSSARVQAGASGPSSFEFVTRPGTGTTDYLSAPVSPGGTFSNNYQIQQTNPATGNSWSLTDITGLQQGVKTP